MHEVDASAWWGRGDPLVAEYSDVPPNEKNLGEEKIKDE